MQTPKSVILGIAVACVILVATGCSSGGGVGGQVAGGTDAASGQSASAIFVQQWAQILWGLVASQTGNQAPTFGKPIFNPDGSVTIEFTGVDGTSARLTQFPDGTARLEITYADGSSQTVDQSKPDFDGTSKTTIDWRVASSSGLTVDYRSVVDDRGTIFDMGDDRTTLAGSSVLPTGTTQTFDVVTDGGQTKVTSGQSDGSTFKLTVPLKGPSFGAPDFSKPVKGQYNSADFDIDLTLSSTQAAPGRWSQMVTRFGGGLVGDFALEPSFAGEGRLSERGNLLAIMSWTDAGKTSVTFVSATQGATSPAGAALDFLLHRWQTLAALLAPGGGTASVQALGRGGAMTIPK
ncbi:MAG TPA: hypothetical protein QGH10_16770 [Armatimonadota bacterium]|nr:hypothetical protein [Armatimonadota bacterium]